MRAEVEDFMDHFRQSPVPLEVVGLDSEAGASLNIFFPEAGEARGDLVLALVIIHARLFSSKAELLLQRILVLGRVGLSLRLRLRFKVMVLALVPIAHFHIQIIKYNIDFKFLVSY